jgi:multiple sugar transport system substrate-binding protein
MRKLLILSIVATVLLLGGTTVVLAGGSQEEAPGSQPVRALIWSGPEYDNLRNVSEAYSEETGNEVIVDEVAREALQEQVTTLLVGGSEEYDVLYIDSAWLPGFVEAGFLVGLSQFVDSDLKGPDFKLENLQPAVDDLTVDGTIYGLPSEGDTAWLFYRADLLQEAGIDVPETWDEFASAAIELHSPPDRYGAVMGARRDEAMWDFMHYFFGHGAQVIDPDTYEVTFNDARGVEALEFYGSLLNEHEVVTPDVTTYGYSEILSALQQGDAAMGIEWMAATDTLLDPNESPKVYDKLEYTLVPGYRDESGELHRGQGGSQWAWVIPQSSGNQEAAYKFVAWLTGEEGAKRWALNGGIPSNSAALGDPEVVEQVPQFELLSEAMEYRNIMPLTTVSPQINDAFGQAAHEVVATSKNPQAIADEAAESMREALVEGGYLND